MRNCGGEICIGSWVTSEMMSSIRREIQWPLNASCRGIYVDSESREVGGPLETSSAAPGTVDNLSGCSNIPGSSWDCCCELCTIRKKAIDSNIIFRQGRVTSPTDLNRIPWKRIAIRYNLAVTTINYLGKTRIGMRRVDYFLEVQRLLDPTTTLRPSWMHSGGCVVHQRE